MSKCKSPFCTNDRLLFDYYCQTHVKEPLTDAILPSERQTSRELAQPTTSTDIDRQLSAIVMRWGSGMTSTMINNCRLNMEDDEFEKFILGYSKPGSHEFENSQGQCDACNGVAIAVDELKALLAQQTLAARIEQTELLASIMQTSAMESTYAAQKCAEILVGLTEVKS